VLSLSLMLSVVTACGAVSHMTSKMRSDAPPSLVGIWKASDGSGKKVMRQNGSCQGFIYSGNEVMDIGGPMLCQLSTKPDASGRYALDVTQSPNEVTYLVTFNGPDSATVYDERGQQMYQLSRF
jgi:hypothetical protein